MIIHSRILMMQQNGLVNLWLNRELFNITVKNTLMAHNHSSNMLNCMTDVFKIEKEFQLNKNQFLKVTLNGLKTLLYIFLGGFALSIVILLDEMAVFLAKLC